MGLCFMPVENIICHLKSTVLVVTSVQIIHENKSQCLRNDLRCTLGPYA